MTTRNFDVDRSTGPVAHPFGGRPFLPGDQQCDSCGKFVHWRAWAEWQDAGEQRPFLCKPCALAGRPCTNDKGGTMSDEGTSTSTSVEHSETETQPDGSTVEESTTVERSEETPATSGDSEDDGA